ncbi:hypothetical protein ACHAC9_19650 [Massilia sp. CMS3.1]|uniref:hypothetical protein n=1 Tax=Massilia sp. CMS3.1 TaxID=3373083 RepID=UPI003EE5093B
MKKNTSMNDFRLVLQTIAGVKRAHGHDIKIFDRFRLDFSGIAKIPLAWDIRERRGRHH